MPSSAVAKDWSELFELDPAQPLPFAINRVETRDFDQFANVLASWNTSIDQITSGSFHGSVCLASAGGCQYFHLTMNQSLEIKGRDDVGGFLFLPIHDGNFRSRHRTHGLEKGTLGILIPEQRINHFSAPNSQTSGFKVPGPLVESIGRLYGHDNAVQIFRNQALIGIGEEKTRQLHCELTEELNHLAGSPATRAPTNLLRMTAELIRDLLDATLERKEFFELDARRALFFRVIDMIKSRLNERITIQPICDEVDISRRTLINLFQDMIRMTPMRYTRALRFNQIRRDLKQVADKSAVIHDIARNWGIEYSGVFAAEYKKHFGELPSATAHRFCTDQSQTNQKATR